MLSRENKWWLAWYYAFMILWQLGRSALNFVRFLLWILVLLVVLSASTVPLRDPDENIRRFTRQIEFEFVGWTLDALWSKFQQYSLGATSKMSEEQRQALAVGYFEQLQASNQLAQQIEVILSDPNQSGHSSELQDFQDEFFDMQRTLAEEQPFVESILQQQASTVLAVYGFGVGGRVFPPLTFEFTQLPLTLIVSPREVIRQDANIPLDPALDLAEKVSLEAEIDNGLNVSSLVVNIGGVGTYPSMILESTSIATVIEIVVHEWAHNYLTLRPLGVNIFVSEELRTMNETAANLFGKEIGREVLTRYYPEFVRQPVPPSTSPQQDNPPVFNFRAEMFETRVTADKLLVEGKIGEAEVYMEERRQLLWENGYHIRKLNQAYFAFHGAYADVPGGSAGDDPVGDAVRELWERIDSPQEFLWTISWLDDFGDLQKVLDEDVTRP